jgi:hypothetical protein
LNTCTDESGQQSAAQNRQPRHHKRSTVESSHTEA